MMKIPKILNHEASVKRKTVVKRRVKPRPKQTEGGQYMPRKQSKATSQVKYPNGYTLDQTFSCVHRGSSIGSLGGG